MHLTAPARVCAAAWADLTGYKFVEAVNRTSAFLQGPATDKENALKLSQACATGQSSRVRLLNYTKSGAPFINTLETFPLRDARGNITHFCGVLRGEPVPPNSIQPRPRLAGSSAAAAALPLPPLPPAPSAYGRRNPLLAAPLPQQGPLPRVEPPSNAATSGAKQPAASSSSSSGGEYGGNGGGSYAHHRPKRQRGERVRLSDALANQSDAVVLTQPHPPYKITHVNEPWTEMCGYTQEEVEGHTNAILQGPETDGGLLADLMSSVSRGESASATLVNYKKGGERFVNQLQVVPVYNEDDDLEQFMALLHEVDCTAV